MPDINYEEAHKIGLKEVKLRAGRHEDPYLAALDELLPHIDALKEEDLGLIRIEIDQVVGTRSPARREAFSASFYPLLESGTEFATKWSALAASHIEEGIRDPIQAVEYLNRFYVVEGHKRVSVLRYFGGVTVRARVKRLLPPRSQDPEIQAYYEFLDFYKITRVNYVLLQRPGDYPALLELLCGEDPSPWTDEQQRSFYSGVSRFRTAFRSSELSRSLTRDEALLRYLTIFGPEHMHSRTISELKAEIAAISPELNSMKNDAAPVLMTDPGEPSKNIITRIVHPPVKTVRAAFLHDKDADSSYWTYQHEQGRLDAQARLGERVKTVSRFHMLEQDFDQTVRELAEDGFDMVFTTTPRLLSQTLTAAGAYPELRFLNCSLNVNHPLIRCYYSRMYEAKFLTGMVAGSMSQNGSIGFVCNYPIYGMPASINAFALGARMVNPRARIILQWSTVRDQDIGERFAQCGVTAISGADSFQPGIRPEEGLFQVDHGQRRLAATSFWDWGAFYEKILRSRLDGSWSELNSTSESGQTINYWWGLSSGVVDARLDESLPAQTVRLVRFVRASIINGSFSPFDGPVYDQSGTLRIREGALLNPGQILRMDWLVDNVEGSIPELDQLTPDAKALVKIQGVKKPDPEA